MSGVKTKRVRRSRKTSLSNEWKVELYVGKTIAELTKVRTPRRFLKNWADELRKLAAANIVLHLVLTKKSELNLNDKDVFPQVYIDVF